MKAGVLVGLALAVTVGAVAGRAWPNAMATPCNGQKPCVELHLGSAYTAPSVKLLCLFDRDFEQKPQIFCGPAQAQTAKFVSITAARIEIDRISGGHVKTLYSVKR